MCRCRDALRRLAIRKIDRREHPGVRRPFHTAKANARSVDEWNKPPPANPCSKILCKSCRRFTTSRAPNKKTVYTPGLDPSGSTHRRLHNIARSTSGEIRGSRAWAMAWAPGARAQEQVDRAAGRQGASYLLCSGRCGRVQCAIAPGCPHVLTRLSPATRDFRMRNTNQTPRIDPAYKLRHEP